MDDMIIDGNDILFGLKVSKNLLSKAFLLLSMVIRCCVALAVKACSTLADNDLKFKVTTIVFTLVFSGRLFSIVENIPA